MDETEKERKIILECQSGNLEGLSELYDLYVRKIYKFIYYKTLHTQTAEDLTSDVFFKALKNIDTFNFKHKFSSWLYKIAQNTVIDHFRTYKKTENIEDVWDLADDTDLERNLDNKISFEKVKKHLDNLSAIQRGIIIMRIWHDMSYEEIAEVVGKSEANCRVIFSRSLSDLRLETLLAALILLVINT